MVDLLVLIHGFIDVRLYALTSPKDVPLVALSLAKTARLHHTLDQFSVGLDHFEEHLELRLLILTWLCVTEHVHTISINLQIQGHN